MAGSPFRRIALVEIASDRGFVGGPFGSSLGRRDYVESGVPVVRGANLAARTATFDEAVFVTMEKADSLARCLAVPGDIVMTQRGTLGQVSRLTHEFPAYLISQSQMALRVDSAKADPDFVLSALRSPDMLGQIHDRAIVTGVPHLNLGIFKSLRIPLPSLAEQRAISSVLGALDGKIESNRRVADAADEAWLAQARAAFRDARPAEVGTLISAGHLVVNDGYRAKNSELALEGVPFIRAGNLTDDGLRLDGADRVPPEIVLRAGIKVAEPWDTAFTSKGTVGRITLVGPEPESFVYSPQVCFWRSTDPQQLSPFVVHAWMRSNRFTAQVNAVKGQTDMADYVSLRDQRAMEFDLPTAEAQHEIARFAEPIARLAVAQRAEALTLAAIRDALLPKLVSGQIRVPLSEDSAESLGAAVEAHDLQEV
jgi:type I restriction enzyme S subunit